MLRFSDTEKILQGEAGQFHRDILDLDCRERQKQVERR